ncbi:hypothetical protein HMPREF9630_01232 [Peptoanaerobacter stomatis]|uniref:Serine/threonine transporter SstT n=1 Tax=Peptoanaerobacter stomatis TaxID=796937 RepID=V9HRN9_9FIRM|nr:serine/threonine transporter SstT [Peptoanaerobacter stomatis]EHL17976.1 hypothetical protein HMPREF9630_01232 [Peptoanaerobacter stomatis]
MKELLKKWNSISLVKRIIVGLIIGTVLAFIRPNITNESLGNFVDIVSIFGSLFVGALKAIAPVLVFFLVMEALCKHKEGQKTNMKRVIALYLVGTFLAALCGVIISFLFPLELILPQAVTDAPSAPEGLDQVLKTLLLNLVDNPVHALITPNYMGILFWAVLIGLALRGAKEETKNVISNFSEAISSVVRHVISFAPFGIMGLIYDSIVTSGSDIFKNYFMLLVVLLGTMLFVAFVVNPIMVFTQIKTNPYPLVLTCIKKSGITAFFTRSSAANIPVNMKLSQDLQLNEDTYSVSIPLGATINMAGAAITISVMALAAVNTLGIQVDFATALILSVLSALAACGASGVAGGSLLLIPLACSLFGISNDIAMQVVGVGFIIGVLQDSTETALNSSTDVLFTATADYAQRIADGEKIDFKKILSNI